MCAESHSLGMLIIWQIFPNTCTMYVIVYKHHRTSIQRGTAMIGIPNATLHIHSTLSIRSVRYSLPSFYCRDFLFAPVDVKCGRIWEKGPNFYCWSLHNFKAVTAIVIKPSMLILQALLYCAPPTSGMFACGNREYCMQSKVGHFMSNFGASPFQVRV